MDLEKTNCDGSQTKNLAAKYWQDALDSRVTWISNTQLSSSSARSILRINQIVDNEIDALQDLVLKTKSYRNSLSLPSRLPTELLLRIFEYLQPLSSDHRSDPYSWHTGYPGYVSITHVCRHWRTVAVNHNLLWSDIILNKTPSWVIQRAGTSNLHITGSLRQEHLSIIATHLPRIQTLDVQGARETIQELAVPLNDRLAAELRCLSLYSGCNESVTTSYSEQIFANVSSHLRTIRLTRVNFPWNLEFINLSSLKLFIDDKLYSFSQMIDGLKHMRRLESLIIRSIPLPDSCDKGVSVRLPQLRLLHVYGSGVAGFTLWRILVVPFTASITLNYTSSDESDRPQLVSELRKRLRIKGFPALSHMQFHILAGTMTFTLQSYYRDRLKSHHRSASFIPDIYYGPDFCVRIIDHTDADLNTLTHDLACSAQLPQLESLIYEGRCTWSTDQLSDFFVRSPSIKQLGIGPSTNGIFKFFLQHADVNRFSPSAPNAPHPTLGQHFPYLRTLRKLVVFGVKLAKAFEDDDVEENRSEFLRLIRCWRGLLPKFKKLRFYNSTLDSSLIAELRYIVPSVTWRHCVLDDDSDRGESTDMDRDE